MRETEINVTDLFFSILRKWRNIVNSAIIIAILLAVVSTVLSIIAMNDDAKVEKWQAEYEAAYGAYWAAINDLDRQISENERTAAREQLAIDKLSRKEVEYLSEIEDLTAKISYYESVIDDYRANVDVLNQEKDQINYYLSYRKEQNENSIFMRIDPYKVNTYTTYLRIDTGYEILPEYTYQNIDRTSELLQTYRLLVSTAAFYEKMISDLSLNTEMRYLTEVISVTVYNTNSLRISVISDDAQWSEMIGTYIKQTIISHHDQVEQTVAEHTVTEYNAISYALVDMDIYSAQQAALEAVINYEESLREINMSILSIEAEIRNTNTEIRHLNNSIEDIYTTIEEIPLEEQLHLDTIAQRNDSNHDLRAEKLVLLEEPEPEYKGHTVISLCIDFVKFAIIGGIVGVIVAALYFAVIGIMGDKIFSADQIRANMDVNFFGFWPKAPKKYFTFVDRWLERMAGLATKETTPETAKKLILSNISVASAHVSNLLLCGGADAETIKAVAAAVKKECPNVTITSGGTIDFDPKVVRGIVDCDAVILVEQMDKSVLNTAVQLKERAQSLNKPVLGVVLS